MNITESMIRELQKRVDVSYEEAERFLRRAGGNIDIAERYALKKDNSLGRRLIKQMEKLIDGALTYRIKIYKKDDLYMNAPIITVLILLILVGVDKTLLIGVVFIAIVLITDSSIEINKVERKHDFSFYRTVEKEQQETDSQVSAVTKEKAAKPTVEDSSIDQWEVDKVAKVNSTTQVVDHADESTKNSEVIDVEAYPEYSPNTRSDSSEQGYDSETINEQILTDGEYKYEDDDDDYYEVTIDK